MIDLQRHIDAQRAFELERVGTDHTLFNHNTMYVLLMRGLIGETVEAQDAWDSGNRENFKEELADIYIFYASVLAHAGFSAAEMSEAIEAKLVRNSEKYDPKHFEGVPVREGLARAREAYKHKHTGVKVE